MNSECSEYRFGLVSIVTVGELYLEPIRTCKIHLSSVIERHKSEMIEARSSVRYSIFNRALSRIPQKPSPRDQLIASTNDRLAKTNSGSSTRNDG